MGDISNEPSMEDILSSIKRIISEEGEGAVSSRSRPMPRRAREQPRAETPEEVLELTETVGSSEEEPIMAKVADEPELVSENAATASRSALASLSAAVVRPDPGAGSLEGLVREMLRPMLKEWLDSHLPEMVEAMVAKEIARITGKSL